MISVLLLTAGLALTTGPETTPESRQSYEAARASVGRDPDAHVSLALWCEAHGLETERIRHLALAVAANPRHALARALLGLVEYQGKWERPDDVARRIRDDAELAAKLAEYNARRARMSNTADAHWRLGLWCEQQGLQAEATAHFLVVTRLDPRREAAWKRLGCKKVGQRWLNAQQIEAEKAEREAQARADAELGPRLAQLRAALRTPANRAQAETALAELHDPHAVGAVWRTFACSPDPEDQNRAVQLLGQIDSPAASRSLVILALAGSTPEVRRAATETLARRDPRDYMAPLIAQLRRPFRYEVRPVAGPGSAGVLYVEGEQFNRVRVYAPPAPDFVYVGGIAPPWSTDDWGFPVLRFAGAPYTTSRTERVGTLTGPEFKYGFPNDERSVAYQSVLNQGYTPTMLKSRLFKPGYQNPMAIRDIDYGVNLLETTVDTYPTENVFLVGRVVAEYQKAAYVAQEQLRQDLLTVQQMNLAIKANNEPIVDLLNNVSGQTLPPEPEAWTAWYADQNGYAYEPPPPRPTPTFVENVPIAYQPQPVPVIHNIGPRSDTKTTYSASPFLTREGSLHVRKLGYVWCCFAADTPIRTRDGVRRIDEIQVGDQVLTQDSDTGGLAFKPVLTVYHFRPSPTCRLVLDGGSVVTTPLHRFWKAGSGWVLARDLIPGDPIRTLTGTDRVQAIEPDQVRPIFNLEVADSSSFFVGEQGILAHDNSPPGRRHAPFDAQPDLAKLSTPRDPAAR